MEEVTDQIDRLNYALQQVMDGIANASYERPTRMSITSADWMEQESEDSLDIPDNYQSKLEELIQDLDRSKMTLEDLWSDQSRKQVKLSLTNSEISYIINQLKALSSDHQLALKLGGETFCLTLDKSAGPAFKDPTIVENSIIEFGHDIMKIRKEITLDVERSLKAKKNQLIEEARKNFEIQLGKFEQIKADYEEKLKECILYSTQLEIREKNIELKELEIKKNSNSGESEEIEKKMQELKLIIDSAEILEQPKIALQIEQLKNKQVNLRTEKAINESKQTTSVLSRLTRAMEKEVSHDEKQRKKVLEKFHAAHNRLPSDFDRPSVQSLKKQEENFKLYMERVKTKLKAKEVELAEKEKVIDEKLVKITGNKQFVDFMRQSVEKINIMKDEMDIERELIEREKLDIVNWNEKIKRVWTAMENYKKNRNPADMNDITEQVKVLGIDPNRLGFT